MRKLLIILVVIITLFTVIFSGYASNSKPEDEKIDLSDEEISSFWTWFSQQENTVYNFDLEKDQDLLGDIDIRLKSINSNLTFTIGPVRDGKRDFIISADGIISVFPYVKKLVDGAQEYSKINIIAFRPRTDLTEVQVGNVILKYEQVFFRWNKEEDGLISVETYVKGFSRMEDDIESAVFLLMDNSIGEYDVETKVGGISFNLYSPDEKELLPFSEFRKVIDENYK